MYTCINNQEAALKTKNRFPMDKVMDPFFSSTNFLNFLKTIICLQPHGSALNLDILLNKYNVTNFFACFHTSLYTQEVLHFMYISHS